MYSGWLMKAGARGRSVDKAGIVARRSIVGKKGAYIIATVRYLTNSTIVQFSGIVRHEPLFEE